MLAALVCVPGSPAAVAVEPAPVRILLVGDSVTHGSSGDWTWRYRLWSHLQASSTPVDLVGPRTDVWDYLENEPGSQAYVDPGFDRDHAARWGMTLALADAPIDDLVETYEPDVVVEMLGTNDLIFLNHTPEQVEQHIENFVAEARSADPDVDVVLCTVTQTWFEGAPELNELLADGAAELDTPESRVLLAQSHQDYTRSEHTFDGSHPNAQGEVAIAASVADQLAGLGIGNAPQRPLPAVPLGPRIPPVLDGDVEAGLASLSWTRSPGAGTSQVQQRDVTAGGDWAVVAEAGGGLSWTPGPMPLDHEVQFRVLPRKGWQLAAPDAASNVVTLTVPRLPGRPKVSVAVRGSRSALVTWKGARRAETYLVELRRKGRPGWRPVAAARIRPRLVLRDLRAGVFDVRVTGTNDGGPGPASDRARFRLP